MDATPTLIMHTAHDELLAANTPHWLFTDFGTQVWRFESQALRTLTATTFGRIGLSMGLPLSAFHDNTLSGAHLHGLFHTDKSPSSRASLSTLSSLSPRSTLAPMVNCAADPGALLYAPLPQGSQAMVINPVALPWVEKSVDVLLAAHVLEMHDEPEYLLREWVRVLSDDGTLILTVFNAWSLLRCSPWFTQAFSPHWHEITARRLRDWLKILGLEITTAKWGMYRPIGKPTPYRPDFSNPTNPAIKLSQNALEQAPTRIGTTEPYKRWEWLGDRWWPNAGAVLLVCAQKKTTRLIPVGKIRPWSVLRPATVQPAYRTHTLNRD